MIGIHVVALLMLIRIYKLYDDHLWVPICLGILWIIQAAVNAWLLTHGTAVLHNKSSNIHACTMVFDDKFKGKSRAAPTASAWIPLLYDTIVVALSLYHFVPRLQSGGDSELITDLLTDGIVYYGVILAITSTLTVMIASSESGVQNIAAQTELLLTVAMMSRVVLGQKKGAEKEAQRLERLRQNVQLTGQTGQTDRADGADCVSPTVSATGRVRNARVSFS